MTINQKLFKMIEKNAGKTQKKKTKNCRLLFSECNIEAIWVYMSETICAKNSAFGSTIVLFVFRLQSNVHKQLIQQCVMLLGVSL